MKLFGFILKKSDNSGKNKNRKIYVDDSDDEVYDHSKPKSVPKDEPKTVGPEDSIDISQEEAELSRMISDSEIEKHTEVDTLCSESSAEEDVKVSGNEAITAAQGVDVSQDELMRQISEKVAKYCSVVTHQKLTKMQALAAESHYYYHRPCEKNPIPAIPIIDGVAKKFGLGRGSIARFRYSAPSIMGWSAVAFATGAYFSLYLIENGLPKN